MNERPLRRGAGSCKQTRTGRRQGRIASLPALCRRVFRWNRDDVVNDHMKQIVRACHRGDGFLQGCSSQVVTCAKKCGCAHHSPSSACQQQTGFVSWRLRPRRGEGTRRLQCWPRCPLQRPRAGRASSSRLLQWTSVEPYGQGCPRWTFASTRKSSRRW